LSNKEITLLPSDDDDDDDDDDDELLKISLPYKKKEIGKRD
jgi:hypothetical protein